jgi:hypothetical protein
MQHLNGTTNEIQVVTTTAANLDVLASFADFDGTDVTVPATSPTLTKISSATTTDVVAAPASGVVRNLTSLFISNTHASLSNTVTIQFNNGANTGLIESVTLLPGERISLRDGVAMRVITAGGYERTIADSRPLGNSYWADQTANAADTYLTGSSIPLAGRMQVGSFVKWRFRATKTAAGIAGPIFNVRVGTAGTTSDTARATITAAAQTAASDTGMFEIDAGFSAVGASAVIRMSIVYTHTGTTTGFVNGAQPAMPTPNTGAAFDVTNTSNIIGLSVNPGTSGVWTLQFVSAEANNLIP